jgi:uncharacterized protein (DUF362 family)
MNRRAITRREAIAGASLLLGTGACSRAPAEPSFVSIVRATDYTQDLAGLVRRILADHKIQARGKRVVLKPNLVEFDAGTTINTHPALVLAAMEAFQAAGAADVRIAEGPGHRRVTLDLADAAGYFSTIPDFEQRFTDLNTDEISRTTLRHPVSKLKELYLPQTALGCDLLVSMPKMKTHHWVGATLSMKNLFGIVPGGVYGWPKNVLHWAGIAESIVDLHHAAPRRFCIVDGIVGMEGNGPIQGRPKAAGVLVAGSDPISVDATCCRIMRIDPAKIEYLAMAGYDGGTNIRQIGENISSVETSFDLIPHLRSFRLA